MAASKELLAAVDRIVSMLDLTGRIIADPERNAPRVSTAEILALALATEGLWSLVLEADLLVAALEMSMPWAETADPEHHERVALQMAAVRDITANFHPRTRKENTNGNG